MQKVSGPKVTQSTRNSQFAKTREQAPSAETKNTQTAALRKQFRERVSKLRDGGSNGYGR